FSGRGSAAAARCLLGGELAADHVEAVHVDGRLAAYAAVDQGAVRERVERELEPVAVAADLRGHLLVGPEVIVLVVLDAPGARHGQGAARPGEAAAGGRRAAPLREHEREVLRFAVAEAVLVGVAAEARLDRGLTPVIVVRSVAALTAQLVPRGL